MLTTRRMSEDTSPENSQWSQREATHSAVSGQRSPPPDQTFAPSDPFSVRPLDPASTQRKPQPGRGRRSQTVAVSQGGHYIRATMPQGSVHDIAVDATLRAAALRLARGNEDARRRGGEEAKRQESIISPFIASLDLASSPHFASPPHLTTPRLILPADLRTKIRRARTGNLILFVVDASGSMGARQRMIAVKGAVLSLLLDAYQKRDRVGLIAFRGQGAEVLVPPTNSVELAEQRLRQMPTGGRTPLVAGLQLADQVLTSHLQRDAALTPLLVLITDGRPNVGSPAQLHHVALALAQKRIAVLVLDSEQNFVHLGAAREVAAWLEAEYLLLDELRAGVIAGRVRQRLKGI